MQNLKHLGRTNKWMDFTVMIILLFLVGCGKDLEKETFDVFLVVEGGEKKVDTVVGISLCRVKAENLAVYNNYIKYDYYCCLKTADNPCAEKHQ